MAVATEYLPSLPGHEPDSFEALFAFWQTFDIPEGYRAEIAEGAIRMNPPPDFPHNVTASAIHEVLHSSNADVVVVQTQGLEIIGADKLYIPDVLAIDRPSAPTTGLTLRSIDVVLVVEVTSRSSARIDRREKLAAYAKGGVSQYLLVDRVGKHPAVTLFTDPVDGEYQHVVKVPYGESIYLPEPFDFDLDTSQFPR